MMHRLWMRLLGRPTLRPRTATPPWESQHHEWRPGLHFPGDKCVPLTSAPTDRDRLAELLQEEWDNSDPYAIDWDRLTQRLINAGVILSERPPAAPEGLDVERLARALVNADGVQGFGGIDMARRWAAAIAREYAATPEPLATIVIVPDEVIFRFGDRPAAFAAIEAQPDGFLAEMHRRISAPTPEREPDEELPEYADDEYNGRIPR